MAQLVLIRGIPGSGKSTLAATDYPLHVLCEADQYFMVDGEYKFDPSKIRLAHQFCQNKAKYALATGRDVVVANTFIKEWELQAYLDMDFDSIQVITATGNYGSIHGVPAAIIERMTAQFEEITV